MDTDGIDIFFLNRPAIFGVTSKSQIIASFANPPAGSTPMFECLTNVINTKGRNRACRGVTYLFTHFVTSIKTYL